MSYTISIVGRLVGYKSHMKEISRKTEPIHRTDVSDVIGCAKRTPANGLSRMKLNEYDDD